MALLRNKIFPALISASLLCAANAVFAESVAVKQDQIFIADKGLVVKNLLTGQLNQCTVPPLLDPSGNDVTRLLDTASDVVIKRDYAIVTVHPVNNQGNTLTDTITVDVSKCFAQKTVPVKECISTVDLNRGVLIIPCVEINGSIVTVHMDRRGNSSNWEVTFFQNNANMANYSRDDDDDDDDDDDNDRKSKGKNQK